MQLMRLAHLYGPQSKQQFFIYTKPPLQKPYEHYNNQQNLLQAIGLNSSSLQSVMAPQLIFSSLAS
jgi:hypothetical protein